MIISEQAFPDSPTDRVLRFIGRMHVVQILLFIAAIPLVLFFFVGAISFLAWLFAVSILLALVGSLYKKLTGKKMPEVFHPANSPFSNLPIRITIRDIEFNSDRYHWILQNSNLDSHEMNDLADEGICYLETYPEIPALVNKYFFVHSSLVVGDKVFLKEWNFAEERIHIGMLDTTQRTYTIIRSFESGQFPDLRALEGNVQATWRTGSSKVILTISGI